MSDIKKAQLNDSVFSTKYGRGTVIDADEARLTVRFGVITKTFLRANQAEMGEKQRTLYWHDPFIIEPPKAQNEWKLLRNFITGVRDYAETLKG
jgi:hypothetical protein